MLLMTVVSLWTCFKKAFLCFYRAIDCWAEGFIWAGLVGQDRHCNVDWWRNMMLLRAWTFYGRVTSGLLIVSSLFISAVMVGLLHWCDFTIFINRLETSFLLWWSAFFFFSTKLYELNIISRLFVSAVIVWVLRWCDLTRFHHHQPLHISAVMVGLLHWCDFPLQCDFSLRRYRFCGDGLTSWLMWLDSILLPGTLFTGATLLHGCSSSTASSFLRWWSHVSLWEHCCLLTWWVCCLWAWSDWLMDF